MLPELKVKIEGDTSGFQRAIDNVSDGLETASENVRTAGQRFKDFGQSTQDFGRRMLPVSGAVTAIGVAMFGTATAAANAGNEIDKSSTAASVSAEAYQELGFAIGQVSDLTQQQLGTALEGLTRRMGQAADGNENLQEAFGKIGISLEDIQSGAVTTEDAFTALTEAAGGMASDAEAAAIAADLLGRSGASLGPILRESGGDIAALRDRARELGIVMGGDAVGASAEFVDKMTELRRQSGALRDRLGVALIPVFLQLAEGMQDKVIPAIEGMIGGITQAIDWFGALPDGVQAAAGIIAGAFAVGAPALMAIGAAIKIIGGLALLFTPAGLIIGGLVAVAAAWAKWGDDIKQFTADASDWVVEKFGEVVTFFHELPERFLEFGRNIITGLWEGLKSAWDEFDLLGTIGGWATGIGDRFKGALGIQSPSRVFHEFGMNIGEGLRNGIVDSFGMVRSAVQGLGGETVKGAMDMAQGVVGAMGQMFAGSKPIAAAMALINTFQGITAALAQGPLGLKQAAIIAGQGFAAVAGIRSASPSSSGGGSSRSSGGGGGSSAAQQRAAPPTQTVIIDAPSGMDLRQFVSMANQAKKEGYFLRFETA